MNSVPPLKNALMGAAAAALVAAPAAAELNYFWTYSEGDLPGQVVNTLNFISSADSFVAGLYAQTLPVSPFIDPSGDLMPDAGSQSFFSGGFEIGESGYEDPILAGSSYETGGTFNGPLTLSGGTIDAGWISNWPENSFPTGDIANPIMGGQFTLDDGAEGNYGFRLANSEDVVLHLNGVITNGRFSQRMPGDINLDGFVDGLDIQPFVNEVSGSGTFPSSLSDINLDGVVDGLDIQPFVALLTGSSASASQMAALAAIPEPGTLMGLVVAGGLVLRRRR